MLVLFLLSPFYRLVNEDFHRLCDGQLVSGRNGVKPPYSLGSQPQTECTEGRDFSFPQLDTSSQGFRLCIKGQPLCETSFQEYATVVAISFLP